MVNIKIYTKTTCPYCRSAKELLTYKGVEFEEVSVDNDTLLRAEMERLSGRKTVPQIFINGESVGGCDDLYALDAAGKLNKMLEL